MKKRAMSPVTAEPSEEQVEQIARDLVKRASGLKGSEFKKELNAELKKWDKRVLLAAQQLAAKGELYRWSSAKKVRFYSSDPLETLPLVAREVLGDESITDTELAKRIESKQRGLGDLTKEWLKQALGRGEVFQGAGPAGSKTKRFAANPDVAGLLKKVIIELNKVVESAAGRHVGSARLLEALAREMGVSTQVPSRAIANNRARFLQALSEFTREQPSGALLSLRELRARTNLDKTAFDATALALSREGTVTLHHHDHPGSLPQSDRTQLVVDDNGTFYVGIALRSDS